MTGERMYPLLPCRDVDEAVAFCAALGFVKTYRQTRPNPYAVVQRDERPRKKYGTVYGFSVVDMGGNWLRISKLGEVEPTEDDAAKGPKDLAHLVELASRLADGHGDDAKALRTLEGGIARFPDAAPVEHARALLYRAELAGACRSSTSHAALREVEALPLADDERCTLADEIAHVTTLAAG